MDKWDASDKSNGMREWDLESSFSSWRRLEKAQHWNEVGRSELAVREMQEALRDDPNNPDLHAYLGWSLSWTEDPAGAEREATAALALDPESSSARALLGCLHTGAGRFV
ncbi:MAG: hypothetical protein FJX77_09940, partial [Armatimonadetes bacterium]|nr:hypothetical protein [Armatimonadota bacterium]